MIGTLDVAKGMEEDGAFFDAKAISEKFEITMKKANGILWNIHRAPKYVTEIDDSAKELSISVITIDKPRWSKGKKADIKTDCSVYANKSFNSALLILNKGLNNASSNQSRRNS